MRRVTTLGASALVLALTSILGLTLMGGRPAARVAAQTPVSTCVNGSGGTETCTFQTSTAINADVLNHATMQITVLSPAGVNIVAASVLDNGGGNCSPTSTNSPSIALSCSGVSAGASASVTFSSQQPSITASVTYNANQTAYGPTFQTIDNNGVGAPPPPCAPPFTGNTTWNCYTQVYATVYPGNSLTLKFTVRNTNGGTWTFSSVPFLIGGCQEGAPPPPSPYNSGTTVTVTWTCASGQSIQAGTTFGVSGTVSTGFAGNGDGESYSVIQNSNCPVAGSPPVPATSPCAQFSGPSTTTFSFQNPSAIPSPGPGTPVTTVPSPGTGTPGTVVPTPGTGTPGTTVPGSPSPSAQPGITVSYAAGWNLVAGPSNTVLNGALGPIYTFQASDSNYETLSSNTPLAAGLGYWALFATPVTETLPLVPLQTQTIALPPSHWVMVGNPNSVAVNVSGADIVYTYSPTTGYTLATSLAPGQGAWVFSHAGGTLVMGVAPPTPPGS